MKIQKTNAENRSKHKLRCQECKLGNRQAGVVASGLSRFFRGWFVFLSGLQLAAATAQTTNDIPPLYPPHEEIPPSWWEQHGWSILSACVVLLVFTALAAWRFLRAKPEMVLPPETKARLALEQLRSEPETGAVLSQVSQILRRYLVTVFELPPEELTTTEFCRVLEQSAKVGPELAAAVGKFLCACDRLKFSPTEPPLQFNGAAQALDLVERAELRRAQVRQAIGTPKAQSSSKS